MNPPRGWAIQTSRAHHNEKALKRATPNHLETSFKSNKRESKTEDASSALEMNLVDLTLKARVTHLKSFSHPSPSSKLSKI